MSNAKFDLLMREMVDIAAKVELFPDAVKEAAFNAMVDTLLAEDIANTDLPGAKKELDADVGIRAESSEKSTPIEFDFAAHVSSIYGRIKYRRLNDMEFCAFVAYYFTRLAQEPQIVNGIYDQHVIEISEIVGRAVPSNPTSSLHNASHHGKYLERVGKGVFALTKRGESFVEGILGKEVQ